MLALVLVLVLVLLDIAKVCLVLVNSLLYSCCIVVQCNITTFIEIYSSLVVLVSKDLSFTCFFFSYD
jgi:hypothetical protein